jgi:serine/threonine protein phosphatase PrpC
MIRWLPNFISTRLSFSSERGELTPEVAGFALIGAMLEADARWIDSIVAISQNIKAALDKTRESSANAGAMSDEQKEKMSKLEQQLAKSCAIGQSGSCATCAVIGPDWVALSNLGDCQALWIEDRQATWLTKTHTPADPDEFAKL